jgi:hypothetical protein
MPPRARRGDHGAHEHEGHRVGDQVAEADVQERRRDHAGEAVDVPRLDAVLVELHARGRIHDLGAPHEDEHRAEEDEPVR